MFDIKIVGKEIFIYYDNRQYLLIVSDKGTFGDDLRWAEGLVAFVEGVAKERLNHQQECLADEVEDFIRTFSD